MSFLKGYCFLSQNLYDELLDKAGYDSSIYSKTLLVNFEKSEHIYEFLQTFHSHFDEDDIYISYQTDKLDKIAKGNKTSAFLDIFNSSHNPYFILI